MMTQEDVQQVEGWAKAFTNATPTLVWSDTEQTAGRYVYQVDPVLWRGLIVEFENLALRMKTHLV